MPGRDHNCIYPTPPHEEDLRQGQFVKRTTAGLNTKFSFSLSGCLTKVKEPSLPNYFPIIGAENSWIHAFLKTFMRRTCVANYIFCDKKRYAKRTSKRNNIFELFIYLLHHALFEYYHRHFRSHLINKL